MGKTQRRVYNITMNQEIKQAASAMAKAMHRKKRKELGEKGYSEMQSARARKPRKKKHGK